VSEVFLRWFFVVAGVMWVIAVVMAVGNYRYETGGELAQAKIERVKSEVSGSEKSASLRYTLDVVFKDKDGKEQRATLKVGSKFFDRDPNEGDTIAIQYRRDSPQEARHPDQGGYTTAISLGVLGLLFFGVAAWVEWS
jgi:hypothetical protein